MLMSSVFSVSPIPKPHELVTSAKKRKRSKSKKGPAPKKRIRRAVPDSEDEHDHGGHDADEGDSGSESESEVGDEMDKYESMRDGLTEKRRVRLPTHHLSTYRIFISSAI